MVSFYPKRVKISPNLFRAVLSLALCCAAGTIAAQEVQRALPVLRALPGESVARADLDNYILGPGDAVSVLVYGEDDMTTACRITKDGNVTLPLINQVKLSGLTTHGAADRIRNEYVKQQIFVNPRIMVTLSALSSRGFIMFGQIARPGTYSFSSQDTINLVEAVAMAGGFTRIADPSKITVVRRSEGSEQTFRVDARKMTKDSHVQPFEIKPGDVVTVGETWW